MGFRVWGSEVDVWGLGFGVVFGGLGVWGFGVRFWVYGFGVSDLGFRRQDSAPEVRQD